MKPATSSEQSPKQSSQASTRRRRPARQAAKRDLAPIIEDASDEVNIKKLRSKKARKAQQSAYSEISEDEQAEEEMEEIDDSEKEEMKPEQGKKDQHRDQAVAESLEDALSGQKPVLNDENKKWKHSKGQISFASSKELRPPSLTSKHKSKLTIADAKS